MSVQELSGILSVSLSGICYSKLVKTLVGLFSQSCSCVINPVDCSELKRTCLDDNEMLHMQPIHISSNQAICSLRLTPGKPLIAPVNEIFYSRFRHVPRIY